MTQVQNRKTSMEFMAGYTVRASAAALAFLWSNWEVVYLVYPGIIKARRLTKTSWEGYGFGGYGEWHLTNSQVSVESGHFEFHSLQRFLGCKFAMQVSYDYNQVDAERVSYFGTATVPVKNVNFFLRPIVRMLMDHGGTYCNRIGASAAEQITANPCLVADRAGAEAFKTYQQYLDEEATIRRGGTMNFRFLSPGEKSQGLPMSELELLRKRLENLESKFYALTTTLDIKDFHSSLLVFASDPKMALVKNRTIIEHIAKIIFDREIGRPSKTIMLEDMINQITKQSDNVPAIILAHMRTVNNLGNVGGHIHAINSSARSLVTHDYSSSFSATLLIAEWFFSEYLPSAGGIK
jgi:hypothetical protein